MGTQQWSGDAAPAPVTMEPVIGFDTAMLVTREVICEQVYRNRGKIVAEDGTFSHPNHINRTLGIRDISLALVKQVALTLRVEKQPDDMDKDELRAYAARVLDEVLRLAAETPKPEAASTPPA